MPPLGDAADDGDAVHLAVPPPAQQRLPGPDSKPQGDVPWCCVLFCAALLLLLLCWYSLGQYGFAAVGALANGHMSPTVATVGHGGQGHLSQGMLAQGHMSQGMMSYRNEQMTNAVYSNVHQPPLPTPGIAFVYAVGSNLGPVITATAGVCYSLRGGEEEPTTMALAIAVWRHLNDTGQPWRPWACVLLAVAVALAYVCPELLSGAAWLPGAVRACAQHVLGAQPAAPGAAPVDSWRERLARAMPPYWVLLWRLMVFLLLCILAVHAWQYADLWVKSSFGQLPMGVATNGAVAAIVTVGEPISEPTTALVVMAGGE